MHESKCRQKIAIWGAGKEGKRQYLKLKECYEVSVFYDSSERKWGKMIDGIPIRQYRGERQFVVIATACWEEVVPILESYRLRMIDDFLPSWMFDKSEIDFKMLLTVCSDEELKKYFLYIKTKRKIALIYGNCQTNMLRKMLLFHSRFRKEYMVIIIPMVHEFKNDNEIRLIIGADILWKEIDLFIYQKTKLDNKFSKMLATDALLLKLQDTCHKISILSVYFDGYFVQFKPVVKKVLKEFNGNGLFAFGDKYIDEFMKERRSLSEIEKFLEDISMGDFLPEKEIEQKCEDSLQRLRMRENDVDIGICDYLERFYRDVQLFYSINHPICSVLYEYANRILEYLGYDRMISISEEDMILMFGSLKGIDMVVYPAVIKVLGLKKYEKAYFPNKMLADDYFLDFRTYQKEYIENIYCR